MRASFVFSEVVNGLRRNVTMTIAMILTTAISLGLLGGGLLVVRLIDDMEELYRDKVEVVVFMTDKVSANDPTCSKQPCAGLMADLMQAPGVESVSYESRTEAFKHFKELFASQPQLQKVVRPEALPASLRVNLADSARFEAIKQEFAERAGVDTVVNQSKYLKDLFSLLSGIRNVVFMVAVIQALAALMLISNTIQLSAYNRRTETGIMRLVGASRWYTQLPFLLEAVVAGLIGAFIAIGFLVSLKWFALDSLPFLGNGVFPGIGYADIAFISPILLLVAGAISATTGYLTLRLYVRI